MEFIAHTAPRGLRHHRLHASSGLLRVLHGGAADAHGGAHLQTHGAHKCVVV